MIMIVSAEFAALAETHVDPVGSGNHQPRKRSDIGMERLDKLRMGLMTEEIEEEDHPPETIIRIGLSFL